MNKKLAFGNYLMEELVNRIIVLTIVVLFCFTACITVCSAETDLKLIAEPGKFACRKQQIQFSSKSYQGELCVLQGRFAHDIYLFRVAGINTIKGIDDETTKGIVGNFMNEPLLLKCVPQHEVPDIADPDMVQFAKKMKPDISDEDAKKIAINMKTVEIGRHCTIRHKEADIMSVMIEFK